MSTPVFAAVAPLDLSLFTPQTEHWLLFHRPFALFTWQWMYRLWGLNPLPYHLLSLILHALNSLLLVRLLTLLAPDRLRIAAAAGLVFALFPLSVEAVTWLACWFDLLALSASLGTLIGLAAFWQGRGKGWHLLSIGLYQLAIWSKETAFTLPALALLMYLLLVPRPPLKQLLVLAPHCVLLAINVLQRYSAWGSLGGYDGAAYSFAKIVSEGLPSVVILLLAPLHRGLFPPWLLLSVGIVSAGVLLVGVLVGAQRRLFAFGLGWLALTLIPVLNLLPIPYDLQNTRLLYPAVVGYAVLIAAAAAGLIHLVARRWTQLRLQIATHSALMRQVAAAHALCSRRSGITNAIACLLALAAILAIHLQIQPWLVATEATEDLFAQFDAVLPPARPGTILQYSGMPDNYLGAYVYRLGLDAAFIVRREELYIHWPEYGHVPIPYQALGLDRDFFQVSVQNDNQQSWRVSQLRGVTFPAELPPFPQSHWIYAMGGEATVRRLSAIKVPAQQAVEEWDLGQCQQLAQWEPSQLRLTCHKGEGAIVTPLTRDPMLVLPPVRLATESWTEVVVTLETMESQPNVVAQLYWAVQGQGFAEQQSVIIELPPEPQQLNYHFFIPPRADGAVIDRLRFDPVNQLVPVSLSMIRIH